MVLVEEYEADELADNSEDEKRIARAEKVAERHSRGRQDLQMGSHLNSTLLQDMVCALVVAKSGTFRNSVPSWYPGLNLSRSFSCMACAM